MKYTVKQLAKLAHITVRTLHYYDEVDLLKPSYTEQNGYRYYEEKEVLKLQQILFFRELDFSIQQIQQIFDNPDFNEIDALKDQMQMLILKKERLTRLIQTIQTTIQSKKGGTNMQIKSIYNAFCEEEFESYKKEAQEKWGNSKEYKQSIERTKNWTNDDYVRIHKEGDAIIQSIFKTMNKGIKNDEVQKQIDLYFQYMQQFYECSYDIFRNLGIMYVEDARFAKSYTKYHKDLPEFMRDAIAYYCDIHSM